MGDKNEIDGILEQNNARPVPLRDIDDKASLQELEASQAASNLEGNGFNYVTSFVNRSPFFEAACRIADKKYTGKRLGPKISKLKEEHPIYYAFSLWSDYMLRCVVIVLSLGFACAIFYKTIS